MSGYSVAISPPDAVLEQVRQLKQQLRGAIGWYHSAGALAHLSFHLFHSDAGTLPNWEAYIENFAARQSPVFLQFDHTDSFVNGAFFLAPDEASEQILARMIKDFHRKTTWFPGEVVRPHMSLARRLKSSQLAVARKLIPEVNINFVCEDLVLRRFNPKRGQYDIYRRFPFYARL